MLGGEFMRNLKKAPPDEVARRMRDLAVGLTNPADAAAAKAYAEELGRAAERFRAVFVRSPKPE
jgi:hypothetical protein